MAAHGRVVMSDPIRVKTRSIQDLRKWIITQGQFSPCGTELMECLVHIDYLKASQPSAMNLEQATLGVAEALPPSDGEIEEWADQSDLIPDEELVCDEQWQRCFLPEQFYATIRAALARWGSPAVPHPSQVAWPELPDCPEEWRTGDRADTEYVGGLRVGYRNARRELAAMNPTHQQENQ